MHHANKAAPNMTERLENGKIFPLVVRLTVPAVVAQLIIFLYKEEARLVTRFFFMLRTSPGTFFGRLLRRAGGRCRVR